MIKNVQSGDRFAISARDWNEIADAVNRVNQSALGQRMVGANAVGADETARINVCVQESKAAGDIVAVSSYIYEDADSAGLPDVFMCGTPTGAEGEIYAVLEDAVEWYLGKEDTDICTAVISGACVANIYINDEYHRYAVWDSTLGKFSSVADATEGAIRIVAPNGASGLTRCVVFLGAGSSAKQKEEITGQFDVVLDDSNHIKILDSSNPTSATAGVVRLCGEVIGSASTDTEYSSSYSSLYAVVIVSYNRTATPPTFTCHSDFRATLPAETDDAAVIQLGQMVTDANGKKTIINKRPPMPIDITGRFV